MGRRMCEGAALLVENRLPAVRWRQWVLTFRTTWSPFAAAARRRDRPRGRARPRARPLARAHNHAATEVLASLEPLGVRPAGKLGKKSGGGFYRWG